MSRGRGFIPVSDRVVYPQEAMDNMLERLFRAIRSALWSRWNGRLSAILVESKLDRVGLTTEEAYLQGYRRAYWDAVVDMVEAGLLKQQPYLEHRIERSTEASEDLN
jgi:hypothetical protein